MSGDYDLFMLGLIEAKKSILFGKLTNSLRADQKYNEWKFIMESVNSRYTSQVKSVKQIQEHWFYLQRIAKKRFAERRPKTGGGRHLEPLGAVLEKVLDIIGRESPIDGSFESGQCSRSHSLETSTDVDSFVFPEPLQGVHEPRRGEESVPLKKRFTGTNSQLNVNANVVYKNDSKPKQSSLSNRCQADKVEMENLQKEYLVLQNHGKRLEIEILLMKKHVLKHKLLSCGCFRSEVELDSVMCQQCKKYDLHMNTATQDENVDNHVVNTFNYVTPAIPSLTTCHVLPPVCSLFNTEAHGSMFYSSMINNDQV